jgi:recombination protein RecR
VVQLPDVIKDAVDALTHLPGVGEKTAFRMVMNMTSWKSAELEEVGRALMNLQNLQTCAECGMFANAEICDICSDEGRKSSGGLCIVEHVTDLIAIEKSGNFRGVYHILGGVLNPLLGIGPEELRLDDLKSRIEQGGIREVILAINPSVEGDATCSYLKSIFSEETEVDRIGFGVPIGGSLEFLDPLTISKALENRKRF